MTNGIDAVCAALADVGIDTVFGVPGTQTIALFEGLRRNRIRTVLASHELAASFMTNGYYRASGRVAALSTIPGPGFTYALTGIAEARHDSVALLYLVGAPATQPGGRFQLQAIDQQAIAAPLVKRTLGLRSPNDAAAVVHEAHEIALDGEPGPVMLELDLEALSNEVTHPREPVTSVTRPDREALARRIEQLASRFGAAERPVLLVGQGAFGTADALNAVARRLQIPIVATPTARGIMAEDDALSMGFDPLRDSVAALNQLFTRADLIVGLGCKLGHNGSAGFSFAIPPDRFVHVDAEREVLGANFAAAVAIEARVEHVFHLFETRKATSAWSAAELSAMRGAIRAAGHKPAEPSIRAPSPVAPAQFFAWLQDALPPNAIVVTDSGLHQVLTRRHLRAVAPRSLIVPSDFQSMGFGLPAAIGAKLSSPDRPVIAIVGDGGFLMSGLELLTARREAAPITVIVFNDGQLNQIRLQQWATFGHAHAVALLNPDFEGLAQSLGVEYRRFAADARDELRSVLHAPGPTLIEVMLRDSPAIVAMPAVRRAKDIARSVLPTGLGGWVKRRLLGGTRS